MASVAIPHVPWVGTYIIKRIICTITCMFTHFCNTLLESIRFYRMFILVSTKQGLGKTSMVIYHCMTNLRQAVKAV